MLESKRLNFLPFLSYFGKLKVEVVNFVIIPNLGKFSQGKIKKSLFFQIFTNRFPSHILQIVDIH